MQTARDTFNGMLEDIVDACAKSDTNKIFTQKVRERDAPGYFNIVADPIDLSVLKGKTKRREYRDLVGFKADMALMRDNSILYNGESHPVTKMARDLERLALKQIREKDLDSFELEV